MTDASLDPVVLDLLRQASTATLCTQLFKRGLRNTFLAGLRPLNPSHARFVGEAFTLRYIPAREDIDVLDVFNDYDHPQRKAVESVGPGQVLVIDCRGETRAAAAGHILVTRLLQRGAAALVTDGSLRDSPEIARTPFPVFAAGASAMVNLALHHAVDMQVPIGCADRRIIVHHVLPNLLSPILVLATMEMAVMILTEASLDFLGLGIQPPETSWGLMLAQGREYFISAWWLVTFPGLAILLTALSFNLLAVWLRSVTDPVQRWRWLGKSSAR